MPQGQQGRIAGATAAAAEARAAAASAATHFPGKQVILFLQEGNLQMGPAAEATGHN